MKINNKMKTDKKNKDRALLCGWIPGTEVIILKGVATMIIGMGIMYVGLRTLQYGLETERVELDDLVKENLINLAREMQNNKNNMNLPPLETLTDILNTTSTLVLEDQLEFLKQHKQAMLSYINTTSKLSVDQVTNYRELIKYIEKIIVDTQYKMLTEKSE